MAGLRLLSVLGQRPSHTGSGVLVRELFHCGLRRGDEQWLVCGAYPSERWDADFGHRWSAVTFSRRGEPGQLPFAIPGMSDVMPYEAIPYGQLRGEQVDQMIAAYDHQVARARRELRPDVIHIHHLWVLLELLPRLEGLPAVVTVHGTDLKLARSAPQHLPRVARNLDRVGHVLCVSRDMATIAGRDLGIPPEKLSVIGNGYNEEVFGTAGERAEAEGKVVLCAGKFVAWKGFQYALRASARLAVEHRLVILGAGGGSEAEELRREAADLGVSLLLPGHLPQGEVAAWMRRADVFLLPSVLEPFGLVLLEALACGCPVIAARTGGPRDLVDPLLETAGLACLVEPLSEQLPDDEERYVEDLAQALAFQLGQPRSPDDREAIAATVEDRTWSRVYEAMRPTYERLARG